MRNILVSYRRRRHTSREEVACGGGEGEEVRERRRPNTHPEPVLKMRMVTGEISF